MAVNPLLQDGLRIPQEGPFVPLADVGAALIAPFAEYLYVDPTTTVPLAARNGSSAAPFAAIQPAIDDAIARGVPLVGIKLVGVGPFFESLTIVPVASGIIVQLIAGPTAALLLGFHTFADMTGFGVGFFTRDVVALGGITIPAANTGGSGVIIQAATSAAFPGSAGGFPTPPIDASASIGPVKIIYDQASNSAGAGQCINAPTGTLKLRNGSSLDGDTPTILFRLDEAGDSEIGSRIVVTTMGVDDTPQRNMEWRATPGALVPTWTGPIGSFRADYFSLGRFLASFGALIPPATPFIGDAPRIPGNGLTDADLTVSLDGGGATSAGFVNGGNWYTLGPATLTMPRSLTLDGSGAKPGSELTITRLDVSANTYTIIDGPSATTLVVLPASKTGTVGVRASSAGSFELVHVPPT